MQVNNSKKYDSTKDAKKHIKIVQRIMGSLIKELEDRAKNHDKSKLNSPERETYDEFIPKLKEAKYGSDEYYKIRNEMNKKGLKHHIENNRHHPDHFPNGFIDMTLVDIVETFSDWYTASLKSDTDFKDGLKLNAERFNMDPMLVKIFENTYDEYSKKKLVQH